MNKLQQDFGVTALLALIAVFSAAITATYLVMSGHGVEQGMALLGNIAIMALGYYVGTRAGLLA